LRYIGPQARGNNKTIIAQQGPEYERKLICDYELKDGLSVYSQNVVINIEPLPSHEQDSVSFLKVQRLEMPKGPRALPGI